MSTDPFSLLDLPPTATVRDAERARRRVARSLHPDVVPGDGRRMAEVNWAVGEIARREADRAPAAPDGGGGAPGGGPGDRSVHESDEVEIVIDRLPAEAFELLFLAASELGDVIVADEPYLLEVLLTEPGPCCCTFELVPQAGGSIVTLLVAPAGPGRPDPPAAVDIAAALAAVAETLVSPEAPRPGARPPG